jgi:hypothetical protein
MRVRIMAEYVFLTTFWLVSLGASQTSTPSAKPAVSAKSAAPAKPAPHAKSAAEKLFATPEAVVEALKVAAASNDQAAMNAMFGPDRQKLLSSDPVEDRNALTRFGAALAQSAKLEKKDDTKYTLLTGGDNWPFPVPIVKSGDQWRFDTAAGLEEILNRRVGENELSAIATCRAYVLAQWEYFTSSTDTARDGVAVYAQKFVSTPGERDGLYWETPPDAPPSPLGALVAQARSEGYAAVGSGAAAAGKQGQHTPFHGYFFKILTRQGPHAPGGKYSYVINGNMIAGYALIAYPDKWGSSGVMTFIVNQQGRVYEKNLGARTAGIAAAITEYDPDPSWRRVRD